MSASLVGRGLAKLTPDSAAFKIPTARIDRAQHPTPTPPQRKPAVLRQLVSLPILKRAALSRSINPCAHDLDHFHPASHETLSGVPSPRPYHGPATNIADREGRVMSASAANAPESMLAPGTRVGHYRIIEKLGQGGMSIVYRAQDLDLHRAVALKQVRPDHAADGEIVQRLMSEARAAASLSHPHIVTIYEVMEIAGSPMIAMQLVVGESLRDRLSTGRPLPLEQILRFGEEIADALASAHDHGILHRDISPANILISTEGRALLSDFGLAHVSRHESGSSQDSTVVVTQSLGAVVGTPGYMSPEQVLGHPFDVRSDLFSFGAVLYEMCTGTRAFAATEGSDLLDATLHREPLAIARLNYEIPTELERIVRKTLAKRSEERYQSAKELLADLRALRRHVDSGETTPRVASRVAPRLTLWTLSSALLVIVIAAFYWLVDPDPPSRVPELEAVRLTSTLARESEPHISPDGNVIAYMSDQSGAQELWVLDIRTRQSLQLTYDAALPGEIGWFPDSGWLAFASRRSGGPDILKIASLGGSAVPLLRDAEDPSISPDGSTIAFVRADASSRRRIWVAPMSNPVGAIRLTSSTDGMHDHRRPAWSPDGTQLAYEDMQDLWLIDRAGGPSRRLTTARGRDSHPVWSRDGRWIYFQSLRSGNMALWRVNVASGNSEMVTIGTGGEGEPSLDRAGTRLAYAAQHDRSPCSLIDLRHGSRFLLPTEEDVSSPAITSDRSRLIFIAHHPERSDLWSVPLASGVPQGSPTRVTQLDGSIGTFALSADGRWIAFHRTLDGQRDVWVISSRGGEPIRITDDPAIDAQPSWSPDGAQLAFMSDRSGSTSLWIQPLRDGQPIGAPRPAAPGVVAMRPAWSPDGTRLAFIGASATGSDLFVMPLATGAVAQQLTHGAQASSVQWFGSPPQLLVGARWSAHASELHVVDPSSGAHLPLANAPTFSEEDLFGAYAISADGELLAVVEQTPEGELWMLQAKRGRF